jgi:hypothetical protein
MTTRRPGIISRLSSRVRRDHLRPVASRSTVSMLRIMVPRLHADGCHEIAQPAVAGLQRQRPVTGGARRGCSSASASLVASSVARMLRPGHRSRNFR